MLIRLFWGWIFAGFVCVIPAHGFNAFGHMLVSEIAEQQLSPDTRSKTNELIALYTHLYPQADSFVGAGPWADDLKLKQLTQFNAWHYISLPYVHNEVDTIEAWPSPPHIVWASHQMVSILQDDTASKYQQAGALMFIIHLVADLHQPLHAITAVDPMTKQHDAGGNGFRLKDYPDANLHVFWDNGLGLLQSEEMIRRPLNARAKAALTQQANEWMHDEHLNTVQLTLEFNPEAWAAESYDLAKRYAYADIEPNTKPSTDYMTRGQAVIKQQIVLAGLRLGALLNMILDESS